MAKMTTNLAKAKSPSKRASVSYDDTNRGRFDLQPYQDRMGVKKEVGDGNEELNLRGCPGGLARKKVTLLFQVRPDSGLCRVLSLVKPWSVKALRINQRS